MVIFHCYVSSPEGKPGAMGVLECETYFGWPSHELLRREIYRCSKWWTSAGPHLQVVTTLGATWRRPRQWPWRKHGQRIGRHGESSLYDGVFFGSREQNMGIWALKILQTTRMNGIDVYQQMESSTGKIERTSILRGSQFPTSSMLPCNP